MALLIKTPDYGIPGGPAAWHLCSPQLVLRPPRLVSPRRGMGGWRPAVGPAWARDPPVPVPDGARPDSRLSPGPRPGHRRPAAEAQRARFRLRLAWLLSEEAGGEGAPHGAVSPALRKASGRLRVLVDYGGWVGGLGLSAVVVRTTAAPSRASVRQGLTLWGRWRLCGFAVEVQRRYGCGLRSQT